MKSGVLGKCCLGFALVLLSGCRTDEERCRTLCEYLDKCQAYDADCTDSEIENCAEDVDDLTDTCQEAFDGVTDCLDENENDCDDVREHCQDEVNELFEGCDGLL